MTFSHDLFVLLSVLPTLATSSSAGLLDIAELRRVSYDAEIGENFLWFAPEFNLRDVSARNIDDFEKRIVEKIPSESHEDYLFVTSKGGQKFACPLPVIENPKATEIPTSSKNPKIYAETLSASFYIDKCIVYKSNSWWAYKLCRGQTVEQFHGEPFDPSYTKNILGIFDGNLANAPFVESTVDRLFYVEESYSAGTFCDLDDHKEPRKTTVRYECDAALGTNEAYIAGVVEVSPCKYLMHVKVGSLCHYPEFLPVSQANSRKFVCQPYIHPSEVRGMLEQQVQEKEEESLRMKEVISAQHAYKMASARFVAMSKSERKKYSPDRTNVILAEMDYKATHYNMMVASNKLAGEVLTDAKLDAIWQLLMNANLADYVLYTDYETMADENRGHLWYYFHEPTWPKTQFPKDIRLVAAQNLYAEEVWTNIKTGKYEYDEDEILLEMVRFLLSGQVDFRMNAVVSSAAIYFDIIERGMKQNSLENDWLYRLYDTLNKDDPKVVSLLLDSILEPQEGVFPMDDLAKATISDLFYEIEHNLMELSNPREDEQPKELNILYEVIAAKPASKQIKENGYSRELSLQSERKALNHFEIYFEFLLAPIYQLISMRYFQSIFPKAFMATPLDDSYLWDPNHEDYKFHLNLAREWVQFSRLLSVGTLIKMRSFFRQQRNKKAVPYTPERLQHEWAHVQKAFENEWYFNYSQVADDNENGEDGVDLLFSRLFVDLGAKKIEETRSLLFGKKVAGYESEAYLKDYKMRKEAKAISSMMADLLNSKDDAGIFHSIGGGSEKKEEDDDELLKKLRAMLHFAKEDPNVKVVDKKKKIIKEHTKLNDEWNDVTYDEVLKAAGFAEDTKVQIKMFDGDGNEIFDADAEAIAKNLMDEVDSIARFQSTQKAYSAKRRAWTSSVDEEETV